MQFKRNASRETAVYEIMHMEKIVASVSPLGQAQISLSYHCVSLNDVFRVRTAGEKVTFAELGCGIQKCDLSRQEGHRITVEDPVFNNVFCPVFTC